MRYVAIVTSAVTTLALSTLAGNASAQNHAEHYVLDGFGGVHAGGGAPVISPGTPYFGFDVAADIEYVAVGTNAASGNGILVLDKFGGVHAGGALAADPPAGTTPYFGFDIARGLTLRDVPPRAAGTFVSGAFSTTSASFLSMVTVTIRAPDDGFLVVTATTVVDCNTSGPVTAELSLSVGGTTPPAGLGWFQRIPDCSGNDARISTVSHVFPVAAGTHTVRSLGRRSAGAPSVIFEDREINVVFVDRDADGSS